VFVDQVSIIVRSGSGGAGFISFRREKYVPKGGPDGGNGGKGGNVIIRADRQYHTLLDQRYKKTYLAENGAPGGTARRAGKWGEDITILVPCGTIVKDEATGRVLADLVAQGQMITVVHGGKGGRGNSEFTSPTMQTPRFAEPGIPGKERSLILELKLIADVGLIGLPNAGKSTLISVITAARPKIADYPFTTLEPNLGIVRYREYDTFTVADIPGLIDGAHLGKGLGTKFLRHIERTSVLAILIDCNDADYIDTFNVLRNELQQHATELAKKPYIIAISKIDTADEDVEERMLAFEKHLTTGVFRFSSLSRKGLGELLDAMRSMLPREDEFTAAE
jgi:GTP-binding protein